MACLSRRDRVAGASLARLVGLRRAWLAAVLCCVACGAAAHAAETYTSRMMRISWDKSAGTAAPVCDPDRGEFPPNLISSAEQNLLELLVQDQSFSGNGLALLSGAVDPDCEAAKAPEEEKTKAEDEGNKAEDEGNKAEDEAAECAWRWIGGRLASAPVTFYIGNAPGKTQPPDTNYFSKWAASHPSEPAKNPRVFFIAKDDRSWGSFPAEEPVDAVMCEVVSGPSPTTDSDASEKQKSSFPWWGSLLLGVGVAVAIIIAAIIVFRCCCQKTAAEK